MSAVKISAAGEIMNMKRLLVVIVAASISYAAASLITSRRQAARDALELARQKSAWEAEKAELQLALQEARAQVPRVITRTVEAAAQPVVPAGLSPKELIAKLQALR